MGNFYYTHFKAFSSSALTQAWYNSNSKELVVEFTSGNTAGYTHVTLEEWFSLCRAVSTGAHYTRFIKNVKSGFATSNLDTFLSMGQSSGPQVSVPNTMNVDSFKVSARVSSDVNITVNAGNIEEAMAVFKKRLTDALGNDVNVEITGVVKS